MKIATYNILKGGSQRVHWVKMIEDQSVDLLLVQESYTPDEHLPPLLYPEGRRRSVWEMIEQNKWGSAVFSRSGSVKPITVAGFSGWVVGAEIEGASWHAGICDSILAFSIHAPVFKGSYSKPVNKILDEISRIAGRREIIIGGDFNLTVSNWTGSERPVSKQDLAIQARLADEFGYSTAGKKRIPTNPCTRRFGGPEIAPSRATAMAFSCRWHGRIGSSRAVFLLATNGTASAITTR